MCCNVHITPCNATVMCILQVVMHALQYITVALHMKCTKTADFKPEMSLALGILKKAH